MIVRAAAAALDAHEGAGTAFDRAESAYHARLGKRSEEGIDHVKPPMRHIGDERMIGREGTEPAQMKLDLLGFGPPGDQRRILVGAAAPADGRQHGGEARRAAAAAADSNRDASRCLQRLPVAQQPVEVLEIGLGQLFGGKGILDDVEDEPASRDRPRAGLVPEGREFPPGEILADRTVIRVIVDAAIRQRLLEQPPEHSRSPKRPDAREEDACLRLRRQAPAR